MLKVNMTHQVANFLQKAHPKHAKQLAVKIQELRSNPQPQDVKILKPSRYLRTDCGEYRIIYNYDEEVLEVFVIDKRNDDAVYKTFQKKQKNV